MEKILLHSEHDTKFIAQRLAKSCDYGKRKLVIYLQGDLGSGKTTFTRYFIQSFGWESKVKSPTYTIVEHYKIKDLNIYHLDLYRLASPEELNFLGLEDINNSEINNILLIEWPERGELFLPMPDLVLRFNYTGTVRNLDIIINNTENTKNNFNGKI
jgi:tRNA threonylcarbamoyladenosine biosynthesis protein TsaE